MDKEKFRPVKTKPLDETAAREALTQLDSAVKAGEAARAFEAIYELDLMGEATKPGILNGLRIVGKNKSWQDEVNKSIWDAKINDNPQEVLKSVRIAHLMRLTQNSFGRRIVRIFSKKIPSADQHFQEYYEEAQKQIEEKAKKEQREENQRQLKAIEAARTAAEKEQEIASETENLRYELEASKKADSHGISLPDLHNVSNAARTTFGSIVGAASEAVGAIRARVSGDHTNQESPAEPGSSIPTTPTASPDLDPAQTAPVQEPVETTPAAESEIQPTQPKEETLEINLTPEQEEQIKPLAKKIYQAHYDISNNALNSHNPKDLEKNIKTTEQQIVSLLDLPESHNPNSEAAEKTRADEAKQNLFPIGKFVSTQLNGQFPYHQELKEVFSQSTPKLKNALEEWLESVKQGQNTNDQYRQFMALFSQAAGLSAAYQKILYEVGKKHEEAKKNYDDILVATNPDMNKFCQALANRSGSLILVYRTQVYVYQMLTRYVNEVSGNKAQDLKDRAEASKKKPQPQAVQVVDVEALRAQSRENDKRRRQETTERRRKQEKPKNPTEAQTRFSNDWANISTKERQLLNDQSATSRLDRLIAVMDILHDYILSEGQNSRVVILTGLKELGPKIANSPAELEKFLQKGLSQSSDGLISDYAQLAYLPTEHRKLSLNLTRDDLSPEVMHIVRETFHRRFVGRPSDKTNNNPDQDPYVEVLNKFFVDSYEQFKKH